MEPNSLPKQQDDSWTKRPLGDTLSSCFVLSRHIDADSSGRWLAFSVYRLLSSGDNTGIVRLPSISWYAIVDVHSGQLVTTGPHSLDPGRRTMDRVVGWSPSRLIVKRSRLIHAGKAFPPSAEQLAKSAEDEVAASPHGEEQVLHSFVCHADTRFPLPPPCSDYMLGNFTLCRSGDCLVFTRFVPVFREQANPALPQRRVVAIDETKSRDVIQVVDLKTGRAQLLGETPAGWRCENIWYDCRSGKLQAIVSSVRKGSKALGVAVKSAKMSVALEQLHVFEKAHWGQISPDGLVAVLVNGNEDSNTSTVKVVTMTPRPKLAREIVIPGWRRKITWSKDSRRFALWYDVWFHDALGRKYQRMYRGYRIWVADKTGANARALAPEWAGRVALTWSHRSEGLFVIANGTLGYVDTRTSKLRRVWAFPKEWYETVD